MIETKRVLLIAASVFSGLLLLACVMIAFLIGMWTAPWVEIYMARFAGPLPPFGEAWTMLEQMSYGPLPSSQERVHGAIRGMLETLEDPYTILVEPQSAQQEQQRLAGRYGDIGVTLWWAAAGEIGVSPYPNGPAERAGVREGDRLIALDGVPITPTQTLDQAAWALQGEADTAVALTLRRPPTLETQAPLTLSLTVTREEVLHPSVSWRTPEPRIGYIRITLFTDETDSEVVDALEAIEKSTDLQAVVLDLRGNGGGVVAPLTTVAGTFLPSGSVVYYETQQEDETPVATTETPRFVGPLAVLVDGGTASAAEILAAALADNGGAILVGEETFGKGSIQAIYPLKDGSTLHITTAVWLTPDHKRLDGAGLTPDHAVEAQPGQDAVLDAALDALREMIE